MRVFSTILAAVALSVATSTPAATLKPWVGFDGSLAKYSMGAMNRELDSLNVTIPGTSSDLWPIGSGPGCGVSAGVDLGRGFSLGVGYDRLFASTGASEPSSYLQIRVPGNSVRGILEYAFPTKGSLGAHLGFAAGNLAVTGQFVGDSAYGIRGSAPLYEFYLGGDWLGQPRCVLFAAVGYRYARVEEVKVNGQVKTLADGSKLELDYSGALLRLGMKVPLSAPAGAAPRATGQGIKPWIGMNGSFARYGMTATDSIVQYLFAPGAEEGTKVNHLGPQEIGSGAGFGGSAGLDFPGHLTLGVGYDWLAASCKASDAHGTNEYRLPANAFRGFVEYRLTERGHFGTRLGLAGGAVMVASSAVRDSTNPGGTGRSFPIQASGPLAEAYGSAEWRAASRVAATVSLGYRFASAREVKMDGGLCVEEVTPTFRWYTLDYSGVFARAGLKVALTK